MKKITLLISGLLILSAGLFAQQRQVSSSNVANSTLNSANFAQKNQTIDLSTINFTDPRCGTADAEEALREIDPVAFDMMKAQKEQQLQNWITNNLLLFL